MCFFYVRTGVMIFRVWALSQCTHNNLRVCLLYALTPVRRYFQLCVTGK